MPDQPRQLIERWLTLLAELVTRLLSWRPQTLLGYLVGVAIIGILVALALIVGVRFHILHRIL